MRKILLTLIVCCLGLMGRAQSTAADYTFGQSTGTYTALSGATSAITGAWDNSSATVPIGFAFSYRGQNFSQVTISSNGFIMFGAGTITATNYTPISTLNTNDSGIVAATGCNLVASSATDPISYLTSGSAGSRVFTVEYKNARFTGSGATETWSFQIKLFETSNIIQVVYGTNTTPSTSRTCQVGIRGLLTIDHNNRTSTTAWTNSTQNPLLPTATMTRSTTVQPASGLTFSWCPTASSPTVTVANSSCTNTYTATASGATNYYWTPATGLSASTGSSVTVTASNTVYTVMGVASNGCGSTARVSPNIYGVTTGANPTSACVGSTVAMGAGFTNTYKYDLSSISYPGMASMTSATTYTLTSGTTDDGYCTVTLPFTFNYYGSNYTTAYLTTNGFINFASAPATNYNAYQLPNASATTTGVFLFARDMNIAGATGGNLTYSTEGTAPFRRFIIYYNNVCDYGTSTGGNSGQIILYETTNIIDIVIASTTSNTHNAAAIQNAGGTIAVVAPRRGYQNGATYQISSGEAWRFSPYAAAPTAVYSWAPASGFSSSTVYNPTLTVSSTTTYTVSLSSGGCTYTGTRAITALSLPTVSVSPSAGCYGVTMTASGAGAGGTYSWTPASGLSSTNTAATVPTPTVATTYTVTGINSNGCVGTLAKVVNLRPTIAVTPTVDTFCVGGSGTAMTASGGTTYSWTPASGAGLSATTGASVTASPSTNRVYTVTGTDAATGCTNTATAAIASISPPYPIIPVVASDTNMCLPGVAPLYEASTGGVWSSSAPGIVSIDASGVAYGVSMGDATISYTSRCGSATINMHVVGTGITIGVTPSSATYCSATGAVAVTASGADTFLWVPSAGLDNPNAALVNASPSSTTTYTVYGTDNTSGCHNSTTVTVTNILPTAITGGVTSICSGLTTTWTNATAGGSWSTGSVAVASVNASTGDIYAVAAGSTTITYTYSGCYVTRAITVNGSPSVSFTPTNAAACGGTGVAITATGASTYSWAPSTGLSATTGATVTANPGSSTTYTITATSASGCVGTFTKTVGAGVAISGIAAVTSATVCPGGSDTLSATLAPTAMYNVASTSFYTETFTSAGSVTGDDNYSDVITLPFAFKYYGATVPGINISTDGWVSFSHTGTSLPAGYTNYACPTAALMGEIGAGIAMGVHDYNSTTSTMITHGVTGTAPNRRYVIDFNGLTDYSGGGVLTGQIVLYETTNVIDLLISSSTYGTRSFTFGIQNGTTGTTGIGVVNTSSTSITTPTGWRFSPVNATYAWTPAAGVASTTAARTGATVASTTTYTVAITDPVTGCAGTATTTANTWTLGTLSISPSAVCSGTPMTASASGASGYSWSPATGLSATTGATVTPTVATTTTYTATAVESHGCSITATKTVDPVPSVAVTPTVGCAPQSLTASGAVTYSWSPATDLSATTGATVTANPSASAIVYTVTGTNAFGCTNTATANVGLAPGAITGTTSVCATLTTTLSNATAGGVWTSSDTTIAVVNASTGVVTGVTAGSCTISYTVGTCSSVTTSVSVLNSPALSATPSVGCANPTTSFTASGATTYTWAPATELSATTGATVVSTPTAVRVYTVTGSNGSCAVTYTVTANPVPAAISGGATTICSGTTTTWTNSITGGVWSSASTAVATVDPTTGVITGVSSGSTTISYNFTGCTSDAVIRTINIGGTPTLVNTSASNCVAASTATAMSVSGATTYTWAPATGLSATTGASVNVNVASGATYTVTGTGTGGCTATITIPVVIGPTATEAPTATPSSTCSGGVSTLAASVPYSGYSSSTISYGYTSFTSAGSVTGDDAYSGVITLPFTFTYYGTPYTGVNISTDGWISFSHTGTALPAGYTNYACPTASLMGEIGAGVAMGVHDYNATSSTMITYGVTGTSPNRKYVIDFNGLADYSGGGALTGQIVLYETSNVIDLVINSSTYGTRPFTFGIQHGTDGATGIGVVNTSTTSITTPTGWRFAPSSFSYAWSPATSLSATTGTSVTLSPAPGAGTYSVKATDASTGCWYNGNTTVTVGSISVGLTAPISVCVGATGTWSLTGPAGATVYYNIGGGATLNTTLDGSGNGSVSQTITVATTLNLVSITAGSCSNSLSGSSTINAFCVCIPTAASWTSEGSYSYGANGLAITGFSGSTLSDAGLVTTPLINTTTGYVTRTSAVAPVNLQQGGTYATSVSWGTTSSYQECQVWIDFNDDGTFQVSEEVSGVNGFSTGTTPNPTTFNISIPVTATTGSHYMRLRGNWESIATTLGAAPAHMDPCALNYAGSNPNAYSGSIADYLVNIIALPPCSGIPTAGAAVASPANGCTGFSTTLSLSGTGAASSLTYQWQSSLNGSTYSNISGATGVTYGATVTDTTIYYRCVITCTISGLSANTTAATLHASQPITGATGVCQSSSTTLADELAGGTWSSSAVGIASVNPSTGVVYGVAAGSVTISYSTTGCTQTWGMAVTGTPAAITGTTSVCNTFSTTLANAVTGGRWSSANTAIATVDTASGVVTGVGVGATTISYSTGCGTAATTSYTVNLQPAAISGLATICTLSATTMVDTPTTGGTWSLSATTIGSINASTGVFNSGTATGSATISYTIGSCYSTSTIGVGTTGPAAIGGATSVCAGATATVTDATGGGTWTSSNTTIATVDPASGVVTGVSNGSVTITYSTGCPADVTRSFTVNGTAVNITYTDGTLTGPVCSGRTLTLNSGTTSGGTYSWAGPNSFTSTLQNPTISAATAAASGTYTFSATVSGCSTGTINKFVAVDASPSVTVTASPSSICTGGTSTITDAVTSPAIGSYVANAVPYALTTFTSIGSVTGDDAYSGVVTLPFTFNYYGASYSGVNVSTDGWISFTHTGTSLPGGYTNTSIPSSAMVSRLDAGVAFGVHDYNATSASMITWGSTGTAPNRKFVIWFNGLSDYGTSGASGGQVSGQIILNETSNAIDLMITSSNYVSYASTFGIQSSTGTTGVAVPNRSTITTNIATPEGWRFERPNYSYTWTPATALSATTGSPVTSSGLTSTQVYSVTTIDGYSGCTTGTTSNVTVTVNPLPTVYTIGGGGTYCSVPDTGVHITLSGSQSGVNYQLYRGATTVGAPVAGTGSALDFGLLTDTTAAYTVVATNPSTTCSSNMTGSVSIHRSVSPTAYSVTGGSVCSATGATIGVANSQTAITYYLYNGASSVTSTAGTGSAISFGSYTVVGVYTVLATNADGCSVGMTGNSTISLSPNVYSLTGGSACSATGVTVGVASSDTGVSYQLYNGGSTSGSPVAGTASAISFGAQTTAGNYTVIASSGSCSATMNGTDTVYQTPAVTLGPNPSVCMPVATAPLTYTSSVGSPTNYNIVWSSSAITAGFSNVTAGALGSSVSLVLPSGAVGSYSGTLTVYNAHCTSTAYPFSVTAYAHLNASIISAAAPCTGYSTNILFSGTTGAVVGYKVDGGSLSYATLTGGTYSLSTGAITGSHTYTLYNVSNALCDTVIDSTVTINTIPMQWVGASDTDWNNGTNWSCGFVPGASDNVTIPAGTTYSPVIAASTSGTTRNLIVDSAAVVTVKASAYLNVKGNMELHNSIAGTGTVRLNGSAAQHASGTVSFSNIEVDNTTGVTIDSGSLFTVNNALTMTAGTLATNDSLVLHSDSLLTARVAPMATGTSISGTVRVQQWVQGGYRRYRFWSHPFSNYIGLSQLTNKIDITGAGGSTNGFTTTGSNSASAFRYDPNVGNSSLGYDPGWRPFTSAYTTADSNRIHQYQGTRIFFRGAKGEGLGYLPYAPSSVTVTQMGTLNQGAQTVPLTKGSGANQDYNMVGNPYASPVDIGTIAYNAKVSGNITGGAYYVWNPNLGAAGQFMATPVTTVSATPYYLQANCAFQVRAAHNGDTLNFTESHKNATASAVLLKTMPEAVTLMVYDANYHPWDMLYVKFNQQATDVDDNNNDAVKVSGGDFSFYSLSSDDKKLAIDVRPYSSEKVIPLGITSQYAQDFVIKAEGVVLPEGGKLYLHDKMLNQYVQLQQGTEYRFAITADKSTQGNARFELSMAPAQGAAKKGLQVSLQPNPASDDLKITFTNGMKAKVDVRILDLSGVSVYNRDLGVQQDGSVKVSVANLASGVYMVELTSGDEKVVQRLIKD